MHIYNSCRGHSQYIVIRETNEYNGETVFRDVINLTISGVLKADLGFSLLLCALKTRHVITSLVCSITYIEIFSHFFAVSDPYIGRCLILNSEKAILVLVCLILLCPFLAISRGSKLSENLILAKMSRYMVLWYN